MLRKYFNCFVNVEKVLRAVSVVPFVMDKNLLSNEAGWIRDQYLLGLQAVHIPCQSPLLEKYSIKPLLAELFLNWLE